MSGYKPDLLSSFIFLLSSLVKSSPEFLMSLTEYLLILRRRGWILILLAVLTAASAYVFSKVQTPVYKATAFVLIQPARNDNGLTITAKNLLRAYSTWMQTRTNAQKVIDQLQLDRVPESLLGDVTIAPDESRFVIQIDVKNENGDTANDIALKWADLFIQWRNDQNALARKEDRVDAFLLDPPRYDLFSPKLAVNVPAGAVLGLLLGGVAIFILEYLESSVIRSPQDVERVLALSVLGAIPAAKGQRS